MLVFGAFATAGGPNSILPSIQLRTNFHASIPTADLRTVPSEKNFLTHLMIE